MSQHLPLVAAQPGIWMAEKTVGFTLRPGAWRITLS